MLWTHVSLALVFAVAPETIAPNAGMPRAVIGGTADQGAPSQAAGALLATASDGVTDEGAVMCSAVLVAPTLALTAAHCIAPVEADAEEQGWSLDWWVSFAPCVRPFAGVSPPLPSQTLEVARTIVHPKFAMDGPPRSDRLDAAYDLALLVLDEEAGVEPVRVLEEGVLAALDEEAASSDGLPVVIAGYGQQAIDVDEPMGQRAMGGSRLFEVGTHELRVGRRRGADDELDVGLAEKCGGDSGGPTFLATQDGWRVIGLTSRGHAADPDCSIAGIDTRVDVFAGWMEDAQIQESACSLARPEQRWPGLLGILGVLACLRYARARDSADFA